MKQVYVTTRSEWRQWLAGHHDQEKQGIWLLFNKKNRGQVSLQYEESVEEALCFGWIDSVIKRVDDDTYCRKFTPRRNVSKWSSINKRRAEKMIKEGRMTAVGLAKIKAAKRCGAWAKDPSPVLPAGIPADFSKVLARNGKAMEFFERLAPTYRKHFIGWITTAKRPETRARRLKESLALLARGEKLGLK